MIARNINAVMALACTGGSLIPRNAAIQSGQRRTKETSRTRRMAADKI